MDIVRVTLRMPRCVADKLSVKAMKANVSKNTMIINACKAYIENRNNKTTSEER